MPPDPPQNVAHLKWYQVTFKTGDAKDGLQKPMPGSAHRKGVQLNAFQRQVAGTAMLDMLRREGHLIAAVAIGADLAELVLRLAVDSPADVIARTQAEAANALRKINLAGDIWSQNCETLHIQERSHFLNAVRSLIKRRRAGSWVWIWHEQKGVNKASPLSEKQ